MKVKTFSSVTAAKPETGDTREKREDLPKGNEDALGGPSPKIDKTKWKPNATNPEGNLKPIDTEGEYSPVPTHKQDIKQKPDYDDKDEWKHDNKTWHREQLPSSNNDDSSGFERTKNLKDQPTKAAETWHDMTGQTKPVTKKSLPDALAEKGSSIQRLGFFEDEREMLEKSIDRKFLENVIDDLKQQYGIYKSIPTNLRQTFLDIALSKWREELAKNPESGLDPNRTREPDEDYTPEMQDNADRARQQLAEEAADEVGPNV
jgi:hypothetical protein